jgi:hypothetical protein
LLREQSFCKGRQRRAEAAGTRAPGTNRRPARCGQGCTPAVRGSGERKHGRPAAGAGCALPPDPPRPARTCNSAVPKGGRRAPRASVPPPARGAERVPPRRNSNRACRRSARPLPQRLAKVPGAQPRGPGTPPRGPLTAEAPPPRGPTTEAPPTTAPPSRGSAHRGTDPGAPPLARTPTRTHAPQGLPRARGARAARAPRSAPRRPRPLAYGRRRWATSSPPRAAPSVPPPCAASAQCCAVGRGACVRLRSPARPSRGPAHTAPPSRPLAPCRRAGLRGCRTRTCRVRPRGRCGTGGRPGVRGGRVRVAGPAVGAALGSGRPAPTAHLDVAPAWVRAALESQPRENAPRGGAGLFPGWVRGNRGRSKWA